MVVDDDPDARGLVAFNLELEGYPVATASNGRDALNMLQECRPFVIVLDLEMPVMDGRSFRQRQLQLPEDDLRLVPVVVCSGSDGIAQLTDELRPLACLPKPVWDFKELLKHVEAAAKLPIADRAPQLRSGGVIPSDRSNANAQALPR